MKPTFELHKLKEEFIITSHEDIQEDDFVFANDTNVIFRCNNHEANSAIPQFKNLYEKLTAQQDQIDFSGLLEKEQKEIGWFDVEKLAKEMLPDDSDWQRRFDLIKGFQKAQELLSDRRFTEDNLVDAITMAQEYTQGHGHVYNSSEIIQSLSQKSWKVELEMEEYIEEETGSEFKWMNKRPKLTNGKIKILKLL
jgi:hypothetical protein